MGWDLYSEPDYIEARTDYPYHWEGAWDTDYQLREQMMDDWMQDMFTNMALGEQSWLGFGRRRFHWSSAGNLRRFKQWDPNGNQPLYLDRYGDDLVANDYIDYHLYCQWDIVENPTDPFTPLRFFLGIIGDLGTHGCTLPDVIDHYRKPDSFRRGGFFSSEIGPQWMPERSSKRLLNDVYHNYLWLGFASGSVGGPTMWVLPNPGDVRVDWDLNGDRFINTNLNPNFDLNNYTDEILDSFLSLSRFTSLVRWQCVSDPNLHGLPYRPMSSDPNRDVAVQDNSGDPQTEWVWTAASDGNITVGWIVRNYNIHQTYSYYDPITHLPIADVPECEDPLPPITPPTITITGLSAIPLELVWFDDHKGCMVGNRTVSSSGQFNVGAPYTEPGGFGKSIAFLIQPVGFTPNTSFEALPAADDRIGQIVVDSLHRQSWHDETPRVYEDWVTFTATTKPEIQNPNGYVFNWTFQPAGYPEIHLPPVFNNDQVDYYLDPLVSPTYLVSVEIKDNGGKRISGDFIQLAVLQWP
jgi:hypothetical protein